MPNDMNNQELLSIDNALLRNNEYLIDKMTKVVKDEVATVRSDVISHNEAVLTQVVELSKQAGSNTARVASLEHSSAVLEERLKGLNGKIATVGAVGATVGGFLVFLINKGMGA